MLEGIDFSFGNGLTTSQIKNGGKAFVGRYLSGGNSKDINAAEWAHYKREGTRVILFWETVGIMSSGSLGTAHAHAAEAQLAQIAHDMGDDSVRATPVHFTADAQTQPAEMDYLRATLAVVGKVRNRIYGGIGTVKAAFDAGVVGGACQTYAWSNGQWDNRARLRQYKNGVAFGPATVDLEEAAFFDSSKVLGLDDDFGQWPRPTAVPAPDPAPDPSKFHEWTVDGQHSITDEAASAGIPISTFLRIQVTHYGDFNAGLARTINERGLDGSIYAGTRIWSRTV